MPSRTLDLDIRRSGVCFGLENVWFGRFPESNQSVEATATGHADANAAHLAVAVPHLHRST
jgi:hypothetical protein